MSAKAIRLLNFDNSVVTQQELIRQYHPAIVEASQLAPFCRHWMKLSFRQKIQALLNPELKNTVTFLGSGDFHHIANVLIAQFSEPVSIIVFDNHPDWDILPPRLGCGSWISRILEQGNIRKVIIIGVSTDDISTFSIHTGNLNALRDSRLELYPHSHRPTKVFIRRVPPNASIETKRHFLYTQIQWKQLSANTSAEFIRLLAENHGCKPVDECREVQRGEMPPQHVGGGPRRREAAAGFSGTTAVKPWGSIKEVFKALPTENVYVSIDKDCLSREYALTNWEEGKLKLDELLLMLRYLQQEHKIIAADITGEYSYPECQGRIKELISYFDHPRDYSAKGMPPETVQRINQDTNLALCRALCL